MVLQITVDRPIAVHSMTRPRSLDHVRSGSTLTVMYISIFGGRIIALGDVRVPILGGLGGRIQSMLRAVFTSPVSPWISKK
jgi:hypothetical protein